MCPPDRWLNPHRQSPEHYDSLRRKQPRPFDLSLILQAIGHVRDESGLAFAQRWRQVPAIAIEEEGEDESGRFALVSCPCKAKPVVRDSLAKCSGCERYYVLGKTAVLVVYGDMDVPSIAQK